MVGSETKDGDTEVTTWSATPFADNFLIGGTSNSADFTEKEECATNGTGCAYLTNWNKVTQEFDQKWIFTAAHDIIDIKFDPNNEFFALVFSQK